MAEEASLAIILRAKDEASKTLKEAEGSLKGIGVAAAQMGVVTAAAVGAAGLLSIKMAGDFQEATTAIVTGAGEDEHSLELIRQGLLKLAPEVGRSPKELADGLYFIESAGFHGQRGLDVLKTAAIAARVGMSDTKTVADALTSALNAYHLPTSEAAHVTDILLTTVAQGKMHMSDLAENIGKVMPVAALSGVSLGELGAAIATMTMQGTDAAQATTALRFLMVNLSAPSKAAAEAMHAVGLSASDVAATIHNKGLAATLDLLTDALGKKFPASSADFAKAMGHVKDGTMTADEAMNALKTSSPEAFAALDKMVGGTRGLTAALELSGANAASFKKNIDDMSHASDGAGKTMQGWQLIQGDFNFQMDRAKGGVAALLIEIGDQFLPVATQMMRLFVEHLPQIQAFADAGIARLRDVIRDSGPYVSALGVAFGFVVQHFNVIGPLLAGIVVTWGLWNLGLALTSALQTATLAIKFVAGLFAIAQASGVVTAATWLWNVAMSANPIGIVILAIAALIAIIILIATHTKEITKLWNDFSAEARKVWAMVSGDVSNMVSQVVNYITGLWNQVKAIWNSLVAATEAAWTEFSRRPIYWIVYLVASAMLHMGTLLQGIEAHFNAMVARAAVAGFQLVVRFLEWVQTLPGRAANVFMGVLGQLGAFANTVPGLAAAAGQSIWNGIVNSITSMPGEVSNQFNSAVQAIENFIGAAGDAAWRLGQNVIRSVVNALAGLPGAVQNAVGSAISNIGGQVTSGLHAAGIPGFASGGIISARPGGMLARIGEGGEDEVVATMAQVMRAGALGAGGGGGGTYVLQLVVDGRKMAETVFRHGSEQFKLQGGGLGSGG